MAIDPRNVTAQLHHRAAGNPPSTLPSAAISNCFPGLEFDFRNLWRRAFEGIELHEADGFVVAAEGELEPLAGQVLVQVGDLTVRRRLHGPTANQADVPLDGTVSLEWSNALVDVVSAGPGTEVECVFADFEADPVTTQTVTLRVRQLFAEGTAGIAEDAVQPGELTMSLCSPWQNDYRECGCYYWAASRPDYVNVESTPAGPSVGNNWMDKRGTPKRYEQDTADNPNQHSYVDLFREWQGRLRFIVGGRDAD